MIIPFSPRRITVALAVVVVLLLVASAGCHIVRLVFPGINLSGVTFFSLDEECNLPSSYSAFTLLCGAILSGVIASAVKQDNDPRYRYWLGISLLVLFMAVDEITQLHERLVLPLRSMFHLSGYLYYSWVVVAIPLAVCVLLVFFRFLQSLPRPIRTLLILGGMVFVTGAVGVEMIGARISQLEGREALPYLLAAHLEELLEMSGVILFLHALTSYIAQQNPQLKIVTAP